MDKKQLIKELSSKKISHVKFKNNFISLVYDNKKLKNNIVRRREKLVANWSRISRRIYCDKNVKEEDILPLLVHETIEKYVTEKYKLDVDKESHKIAQAIERRFIGNRRNWLLHEKRIAWLWKNINN